MGESVFITDQRGDLIAFSAATLSVLFAVNLNSQPLNQPAFDSYTGDLYISTHTGLLYRVDAVTGRVIWVNDYAQTAFGGSNQDLYPATAAGKSVLLALDLEWIFAVDAKIGKLFWKNLGLPNNCEIGSYMPAAVAYGLAFQANPDCGTDAFNLATGHHVWHTSVGGPLDVPLTSANRVLYLSGLEMLNTDTGGIAARLSFPCNDGDPTVVNGTVYMISLCNAGSYTLAAYRT